MSKHTVTHFLAVVVLTCVAIVLAIDALADFNTKVGLRLKWSLLWYLCRYIGSVCAAVLALDVLF